ncbi:PAS sensor protein [Thermodesulfobium narugense DSM 14796]|uniref:PAS sensor protein n=1 Tax=Thermodesulfobium narugense DSM 14796 TaxID=747365 RepID=M1E932_9BACT|nr:PAS domain S-box protein [Thermodesulfobium narugense]AEE15310.1 PAS sensor protein [Thermodesulfobium narugense DSM 14796]
MIKFKGRGKKLEQFDSNAMKRNMLKLIEQDGEWYLHLLNLSPNCVEVIDLEGKLFFCNESHKNVFGYEAHTLIGKYWYELLPEEDRPRAKEIFKEIVEKSKRPHSIPMRGLRSDGEIINLWVRWNYLKLGDSSVFGIFAVISDISELLSKKEHIISHEQSMELVSSKTPCAFFSYNYKSKRFHASTKWKKLHSIDKSAKLDTLESLERVMDNSIYKTLIAFINSFKSDGIKETRYNIETPNGKIELVSLAKAKSTKKYGLTYLSGVTLQLEDESCFEEEYKNLYSDLIEKNASIIFTFNPDNLKILDFNNSFLKLTGFSDQDLKDKSLFELFPVESQKLTIISKELYSKGSGTYSVHLRCKNSRIKDISMNCSFHRSGKNDFILCILEDQTEKNIFMRKLLERERENIRFKESLESIINLECEKKLNLERTQLIRTGYEALKFSTDFICENVESNLKNIYQKINKIQNTLREKNLLESDLSKVFKECSAYFELINLNISKFKSLKSTKLKENNDVIGILSSCSDMYKPIWESNNINFEFSINDEVKTYPKDKEIFRDVVLSIYSIITKNMLEESKHKKERNFKIRVLLTRSNDFVNIEFFDNAISFEKIIPESQNDIGKIITNNLQAISSLTTTYLNGILLYRNKQNQNIFHLKIPTVVL